VLLVISIVYTMSFLLLNLMLSAMSCSDFLIIVLACMIVIGASLTLLFTNVHLYIFFVPKVHWVTVNRYFAMHRIY